MLKHRRYTIKSRVLVTGGAGYIGSHTAKALHQAGHIPVVLDNLSTGHRWAVKWGPFVQGDLADQEVIRDTLVHQRIDAVFHFAGKAYVAESIQQPCEYFRENIANTLNLLDAMRDGNVMRLVFSSSCATYGVPEQVPISEDHPQRPINPYGESKLFVERILQWCREAYGLEWVSLRYFNATGADPEGELGELHVPEPHLVPVAIQTALGKRDCMTVHGIDYPTPDGSCIRDYTHVADLAQAHVLALNHLLGEGESRAFNLGTGKGHSVLEVIRLVEQVTGSLVPTSTGQRREGDPPKLIANSALAMDRLGWTPQYSDIRTMVETSYRWYAKWSASQGSHPASTGASGPSRAVTNTSSKPGSETTSHVPSAHETPPPRILHKVDNSRTRVNIDEMTPRRFGYLG